MASSKELAVALAAGLALVASARAQGLNPQVTQAAGTPLDPGQLYAVETTCTKGASLPPYADRHGWQNLLPQNKKAMTFFVTVQTQSPTGIVAIADALKSSLLVSFSFSVDQSKQQLFDNRAGGSCNQFALVYGQSALYAVPITAYSTEYNPGTIATAFDEIAKLVAQVAPLFASAATSGALSKNLGQVNGAVAPITNLISTFNSAQTDASAQPISLVVGDTLFSTPYAAVKITVRPISSVIRDRHTAYRISLKTVSIAAATGTGNTIDTSSDDKLHTSCELVAAKLAQQGFASSLDQDYGVIHAASPPITTREQMQTCLGLTRELEAASAPSYIMYEGIISSVVPTHIQPGFSDIRGTMSLLTQQMGRYVKLAPPPKALASAIESHFVQGVPLNDPVVLFPDAPSGGGMPALIDYLAGKGYHHIGFYAQVTHDMQAAQEFPVIVGLVAIKADASAASGCFADAIALYPHFASNKIIDQLSVSGDLDEVRALVGSRATGGDNGFTMKDCTGQPPAGAAAHP